MAKSPNKGAVQTAAAQAAAPAASKIATSSAPAAIVIAKGANAQQVSEAQANPANAGVIQQVVPGVWSKTAPPSLRVSKRESDAGSPQRPALAAASVAETSVNAVKAAIDPNAFYSIVLGRVATAFNQTFRPMHAYVVKGKVVSELGDAVKSYELSSLEH